MLQSILHRCHCKYVALTRHIRILQSTVPTVEVQMPRDATRRAEPPLTIPRLSQSGAPRQDSCPTLAVPDLTDMGSDIVVAPSEDIRHAFDQLKRPLDE